MDELVNISLVWFVVLNEALLCGNTAPRLYTQNQALYQIEIHCQQQ